MGRNMQEIKYTMLWQDENAKAITEYFNSIGIGAYYKGTGFEGTGLMLPMQAPTIFVDETKIEEAMSAYEEWKGSFFPQQDGMTDEEKESTAYYKQEKWMSKIFYVVFWLFFGGGIILLLVALGQ